MDLRFVVLAIVAVSACAEPTTEETSQPLESRGPGAAAPPVDTAEANVREREIKRATSDDSPRGPVAAKIDWDEARRHKQIDPSALPEEQRAKLAAITVPVMGFDDEGLLSTAMLTHNENWYALAVKSPDGLSMNVRGTRNEFTAPNMELPEAARKAAENYTLTRTHGVLSITWRAFGASYILHVDCPTVTDSRCAKDTFGLATVESLGLLGGQP